MATLPTQLTTELAAAYTVSGNTLVSTVADFHVQVGDLAQPTLFAPTLQIQRWPGPTALYETAFTLHWVDPHATLLPTITYNGNRVIYSTPTIDVHFYDQGWDENNGAFEFEILLKAKPVSNILTFALTSVGLSFFYQPPLANVNADGSTWERQAKRPANVSGSYAVYHSTMTGDHTALGGQNYKAGKAFHLYRPHATDSSATPVQTWGTINITGNVLTVTVPQAFLDAATYPVIVDPTFGYTTQGASTDANGNVPCYFYANTTPASSGTVTAVTAYVQKTAGNTTLDVAIYSNTAGSPAVANAKLVAVEPGTVVSSASMTAVAVTASLAVTSGTQYWLALREDLNVGMNYAFDALGLNSSSSFEIDTTAGAFPATARNGGQFNESASIWATYTASGGSRSLFRQSTMTGLGVGGSFFANPLSYPCG